MESRGDGKEGKKGSERNPTDKPTRLIRQNATDNLFRKPFKFKESKNPLDYANLSKVIGKKVSGCLIVRLGAYLHFNTSEDKPIASPRVTGEHIKTRMKKFQTGAIEAESIGWKLHISVNSEDIDAAWAIINPILMEHRISGIKVISPDVIERVHAGQTSSADISSKQFTIYQFRNTHLKKEEWEAIIKKIEEALISNNIKPNEALQVANKAIAGSRYFSYRNDTDPKETIYISDVDADAYAKIAKDPSVEAHNLRGEADPFESLKPFSVPHPSL